MKAVLTGTVGDDRLYYILDAPEDDADGIIERDDGSTVRVDFFSFAARARGLKRLRTTRFHRFLWDQPSAVMKAAWHETFIQKTREINKNMLEDVITVSSVGSAKKKLKSKVDAVNNFLTKNDLAEAKVSSACCGQMVKSFESNLLFKSPNERREAWIAMQILRQIES